MIAGVAKAQTAFPSSTRLWMAKPDVRDAIFALINGDTTPTRNPGYRWGACNAQGS